LHYYPGFGRRGGADDIVGVAFEVGDAASGKGGAGGYGSGVGEVDLWKFLALIVVDMLFYAVLFFAAIIFAEIPNLLQCAGAVLVIGGVMYYSLIEKRKQS